MPKLKIAGTCFLMSLVLISISAPVRADDTAKDEETLEKASTVLQAMLDAKTVPQTLLVKADCVIVLPSVKKGAFIIGGTGGRGPMICRSGKKFIGRWGAPAMYSIGGTSIGLQVGGTASDFVLLVMSPPALDKLLEGKSKLGSDMAVAAGPGATSTGSVSGAEILSYGRSSGLFVGISLSGASLSPDNDANRRLYGKTMTARDIVMGTAVKPTPGSAPLVAMLNTRVPVPKPPVQKSKVAKHTTPKPAPVATSH
jgi:SH3 domain-containing YSC84-like protein 1